jgi:hypothetical protein
MKKMLMKVYFFDVQISRYVFDALNELHRVIIKFISTGFLAWQFVIDLIIYFLLITFAIMQATTLSFRPFANIH